VKIYKLYDIEKVYLYEVFDEYRCSNTKDGKNKVWKDFCNTIWGVQNKRQIYKRYINFKVLDDTEKNIFKKYSSIPYLTYKKETKNLNSWHLLRQKINNIYSRMCDKRVCEKKEYFNALRIAKDLYFEWIKDKTDIDEYEIEKIISKGLMLADNLHNTFGNQKLNITWDKYKLLINSFLLKCLENYIPLDEFEDKTQIVISTDYWLEDNYVVKYIGNSLTGYMKNYEKKHHGVTRKNSRDKRKYNQCRDCNKSFLTKSKSNNIKRCPECQREKQLEWQRNSMRKQRINVKLSN
jgi:hypothetical protein